MHITKKWKEELHALEKECEWDEAIAFMQKFISANPDNMDGYMFMNFLLMNLLVEEYYRDTSKDEFYEKLLKKYFNESYAKFSENAEFLYLMGRTAGMSEWLFGIEREEYEAMIAKAMQLEPDNLVYKEQYYWKLYRIDPENPEIKAYKKMLWTSNNPVEQQLKDKGALGEYFLELKRGWAGKPEE